MKLFLAFLLLICLNGCGNKESNKESSHIDESTKLVAKTEKYLQSDKFDIAIDKKDIASDDYETPAICNVDLNNDKIYISTQADPEEFDADLGENVELYDENEYSITRYNLSDDGVSIEYLSEDEEKIILRLTFDADGQLKAKSGKRYTVHSYKHTEA